MNLPKKLAAGLILAVLAMGWTGCKTHKAVIVVGNGYEEVSHPSHNLVLFADPVPPRVSFQYRATNDIVTPIWPALYGVNEVIKGDLAVFVGDKAYVEPERVTHPRLFVVKSPDLPVDITDEMLRVWAQATKRSYSRAQDQFALATPEEKNGGLKLRLDFSSAGEMTRTPSDWPLQSALLLNWQQVDDLMHTVKVKGMQQKDLRWDTPYIGESPKRQ